MNTDSTDTRSPHLDMAELVAGAAGQPLDDKARGHLAGCHECQLEAKRWNVVAEAVRRLEVDALETAPPAWPPARPAHHLPQWQRAVRLAAGVAAGLVLLFGIGIATGTVHVHLSAHSSQTVALTAVSGCDQLDQADGTLEQVDGTNLVIRTSSGQPVMVTTTASTYMSISGAVLSDITDGASVMVHGHHTSHGTFQAAIITLGQPFSAVEPAGFASVQGTVRQTSTDGFVLVTASGGAVPVSTSAGTLVVVPHASPSQLVTGTAIFAVGYATGDATLSAKAVAAVTQLPRGRHISVSTKGCSSSEIVEALGAISTSPASAG